MRACAASRLVAAAARTSISAPSARVTSIRSAGPAPFSTSIASAISSAFPQAWPSGRSIAVSSATTGQPWRAPRSIIALARFELVVELRHERPRASLHVEHETGETLRELLAHDARRDQRNDFYGCGRVAQRVELAVRRHDLGRLAQHRAADFRDLLLRISQRELRPESRNRFELVERAAGVPEAAPGHHRHRDPE